MYQVHHDSQDATQMYAHLSNIPKISRRGIKGALSALNLHDLLFLFAMIYTFLKIMLIYF